MAYGLEAPVLVLNRHFAPVRVTRARRALMLLYIGAAKALDARYEAYDFARWSELPQPATSSLRPQRLRRQQRFA